MFTSEGNPDVVITEVTIADAKFADAPAFDVCIKVQDASDDSQEDWWRGEFSNNYGMGSKSHMTQAQITIETLVKLGFEGGQDFSRLNELVGAKTVAWVAMSESNGKTYYNVRALASGGSYKPEALDLKDAAERMKQILGGATSTPAKPTSTAAAATEEEPSAAANPFLT